MHQDMPDTMADLLARFPRDGVVQWIGLRPTRRAPMESVQEAKITTALEGDRTKGGNRGVTLIQAEHLPAIAGLSGLDLVTPDMLRRNIVVSGINLRALKDRLFRIGTAVLQGTGPCAPCSRMEEALGPGGYNAMRGHGGITASVIEPGIVRLGDAVHAL